MRHDWITKIKGKEDEAWSEIQAEYDAPCQYEGHKCPLEQFGIDCERDNDNHCAVKDFMFQILCTRKD